MRPKKSGKASKKVLGKKKMKKARGGADPLAAARFGISVDGHSIGSFNDLQKLAGGDQGIENVGGDDAPILKPRP